VEEGTKATQSLREAKHVDGALRPKEVDAARWIVHGAEVSDARLHTIGEPLRGGGGLELGEEGGVEVDRCNRDAELTREDQGLPPRPAAKIKHARRGRERSQATERLTGEIVAPWGLARDPVVYPEECFVEHRGLVLSLSIARWVLNGQASRVRVLDRHDRGQARDPRDRAPCA
jgi:hypothetical protein